MKSKQNLGIGAAAVFCAAFALAERPKVILNASQLDINDDLDNSTAVQAGGDVNIDAAADIVGLLGDDSALDAAFDSVSVSSGNEAPAADADDASAGIAEIASDVHTAGDGDTVADSLLVVDEATPVLPETSVAEESAESSAEALVAPEGDSDVPGLLDQILSQDEPAAASPAPVVVKAPEVEEAPAPAPVALAAPEVEEAPAPVVVAEVPAAAAEEVPSPDVVAEVPAEAVESDDPLSRSASELATLEKSRRDLFIQHAKESLQNGRTQLSVGNWPGARESFEEAIRFFDHVDTSATHGMLEEARLQLGETYYRIGKDKLNELVENAASITEERVGEVKTAAGQALKYGHPKAKALMDRATELEANPPRPPAPPRVKRQRQEEYIAGQKDVRDRLRAAREYYATGEYTDCRREVELVLAEYPWNNDALALLRKLATREHQWKDAERRTTREDMLRDVTGNWSARTYAVDYTSGDTGVKVGRGDGESAQKVDIGPEMRIREKMSRIIIPEIDFRQANVADVITFLGEASREYDSEDTPNEERGVNLVLDLGDAGASETQAAATDDPWATPVAAPSSSSDGTALITIKSRYTSLLVNLDTIMEMARLKYRVQGNIVMIMPRNRADGDLIHRMYNVLPNIVERTVTLGGTGGGSGDSGDPFALNAGEVKATTDWKAFFSKLGVAWPDESTVEYMPGIGKLVVKNTASNLATLEQVLGALNVTPFQVEIEVRFVEVGQTDLNSLGLEWFLDDDWEIAEKKSDANLPVRSRRRIVMGAQNVTGGFNYLTENSSQFVNNGYPVADGIARVSSILTNPELSVVLHALANKSSSDLLSAPKVVAQNGSQATIKSVVEYIYPTEFEVEYPDIDAGDGGVVGYVLPSVEPQSFQTREVGVILNVTPRVSPDGTRISLDLTPSVVSEPSWKDYGYTYPGSNGSDDFHLTMEQPFFPVRSLATSVDIYNGATVVMGGMIKEERFGEEDKIPILGDIPILGRLFRYKYEQSEKRNLLIFVSARLVDPAGREVKGSDSSIIGLEAGQQGSN